MLLYCFFKIIDIPKTVWLKIMFLHIRMIGEDETILKNKEDQGNDRMERLAMSTQEQINTHLDDTLEPKLDKRLAKKDKPTAFQTKTSSKKDAKKKDFIPNWAN